MRNVSLNLRHHSPHGGYLAASSKGSGSGLCWGEAERTPLQKHYIDLSTRMLAQRLCFVVICWSEEVRVRATLPKTTKTRYK